MILMSYITKIRHFGLKLKEDIERLIDLTKIGFEVSTKVSSKLIILEVVREIINRTNYILGVLIIGFLINVVTNKTPIDQVYFYLGFYFLFTLVSTIADSAINRKINHLQSLIDLNVVNLTYEKYKEIPVRFRNTPEFLKIEKNLDFRSISRYIDRITSLVGSVYSAIAFAITITFIEPLLIFVSLGISLISLIIEAKSHVFIFKRRDEIQYHNQILSKFQENFKINRISEIDDNLKTHQNSNFLYKIYENQIVKDYKEFLHQTYYQGAGKLRMASSILNSTTSALVTILIFLYAADGKIAIGTLAVFMASYQSLIRNISEINFNITVLLESYLKIYSIKEFFNYTTPITQFKNIKDKSKFQIEFKNVSFTYPNTQKQILKNINLKFESGDRVGIIGINGAGKSTIIKLLFKIYIPDHGEIFINGINIHEIDDEQYFEILTNLSQAEQIENLLKIEDIITLGDSNRRKDVKEIINSAKLSSSFNDIESLKLKFKQPIAKKEMVTFLNERAPIKLESLSDGQARKVQIAKMFYSQKPIIVLDEPTSNVDPHSAFTIFKNLNKLKNNHILIFVTHDIQRLTLAASKIYVIDAGEIVEEGDTAKLLKNKNSKLNFALNTYKQTLIEKN